MELHSNQMLMKFALVCPESSNYVVYQNCQDRWIHHVILRQIGYLGAMKGDGDVQIVECPRDAMQGMHDFVPTEVKIRYIKNLLSVGFDHDRFWKLCFSQGHTSVKR